MCPASDRPNLGLFDQERAPRAAPQYTVDAAAGLLLGANASGWKAWGLDPATAVPPLPIDGAMPALQRLREIAGGGGGVASGREAVTVWTARGVARLVCRVGGAGGLGGVTVPVGAPRAEPAAGGAERGARQPP